MAKNSISKMPDIAHSLRILCTLYHIFYHRGYNLPQHNIQWFYFLCPFKKWFYWPIKMLLWLNQQTWTFSSTTHSFLEFDQIVQIPKFSAFMHYLELGNIPQADVFSEKSFQTWNDYERHGNFTFYSMREQNWPLLYILYK